MLAHSSASRPSPTMSEACPSAASAVLTASAMAASSSTMRMRRRCSSGSRAARIRRVGSDRRQKAATSLRHAKGSRRRPETTMNNGLRPPARGFESVAGRRDRGSDATPRRRTDDRRSGPPRRHGLRFRRPRPPWPREPQRTIGLSGLRRARGGAIPVHSPMPCRPEERAPGGTSSAASKARRQPADLETWGLGSGIWDASAGCRPPMPVLKGHPSVDAGEPRV